MNSSLVISYCCLGITCLSCLFSPPYDLFFLLALITTFVYAVLGALKVGLTGSELIASLPEDDINWIEKIDKYLALTANLLPLFVLPCLTASTWLNQNRVDNHFSLIHFALALVSSAAASFQKVSKEVIDAIVIFSSTSLLLIGLLTHNEYTVYADIYFIIAHFCTYHIQRSIENYSPVEDLYQYFLSAFITFAIKSVNKSIRSYNQLEKITEASKRLEAAKIEKLAEVVKVAKIVEISNLGILSLIAEYVSLAGNMFNLSNASIDNMLTIGKDWYDLMAGVFQQLRTHIEPICKLRKYIHF